ncbi:MAG TPA: response regulator [Terriglobales bacterium]|jgi:CheY-like chemotaxis protein|nr:response regulator [Terriglobales bacterium]
MASNIRVLLVDDNPMIVALLRQAITPFASVETFSDAAEALLHVAESAPDLLICDYRMPGLNGKELIEKIRGRVQTAKLPAILIATHSEITEHLRSMHDHLEDLIEKPFFVKEITSRIKRVIDKISLEKMARATPGESVVRGNLQQMNTMDLFQSLELGHKTCRLTVTNGSGRCDMYFTDGQINHALCGGLRGDEAVFKVITWTDGQFEIDFSASNSEQTTTRSTQSLLMEGLRLLDEANRDTEENVLDA